MPPAIRQPEIFGITESSLSLFVGVEDAGEGTDAPARVRLDGEIRAVLRGNGAVRAVRIDGLEPDRDYRVEIEVDGAEPPARTDAFPASVRTLPRPRAREVASFATLNDLHFGEPRFGGEPLGGGEFGDETPDCGLVRESDTEVPYWRFMNEDAIAEIDAADVDATVIKGDIADRGRPEQFAAARTAFDRLRAPWHAFLGNHDHYALHEGERVDGYALLGQPPAPRALELGGWRLLLVDTVEPGEHHGVMPAERRRWLARALEETREARQPTLLFMHHQPVPPEHRDTFPNTIGIVPEQSLELFDLLANQPQLKGVLIGHTHRNRVRRYASAGRVPFIEVHCTKDYPGGWAHYRLFEDGSFTQEVRRTASDRALAHSTRCRDFFRGFYRFFALGALEERSFLQQDAG